jgi:L-arabinose isomerase
MRKFVNSWCSSGPTHHGVLGLGNNIGILKKVSVALDMPIDIICE